MNTPRAQYADSDHEVAIDTDEFSTNPNGIIDIWSVAFLGDGITDTFVIPYGVYTMSLGPIAPMLIAVLTTNPLNRYVVEILVIGANDYRVRLNSIPAALEALTMTTIMLGVHT